MVVATQRKERHDSIWPRASPSRAVNRQTWCWTGAFDRLSRGHAGWKNGVKSKTAAKLDDARVMSGRCGCGKEKESRRRRVHNPGASALRAPIRTVIESAGIPPPQKANEQWPPPPVRSESWSSNSRSERRKASLSHRHNNSTGRGGPLAPYSTRVQHSVSKRDRNRWIFFFSLAQSPFEIICFRAK
jgi:hypothetical protein